MDFKVHRIIAIVFVLFGAAGLVAGQTSSELRARYGEPQMTELKNNRPVVERFRVGPNIFMTIKYTDDGEPCEAALEPVLNSTPKTDRPEHAPDADLMSTGEVIKLINEILPLEKRGKENRPREIQWWRPGNETTSSGMHRLLFCIFRECSG